MKAKIMTANPGINSFDPEKVSNYAETQIFNKKIF